VDFGVGFGEDFFLEGVLTIGVFFFLGESDAFDLAGLCAV
jgi:hypothetical protein